MVLWDTDGRTYSLADRRITDSIHYFITFDLPGAEGMTRPLRAVCSPASTKECLLLSLKRNTLFMTSDTHNSAPHLCRLGDSQPSSGFSPSMMTWLLSEMIRSGDHDSMQSWVAPTHCSICLDDQRKFPRTFSTILFRTTIKACLKLQNVYISIPLTQLIDFASSEANYV